MAKGAQDRPWPWNMGTQGKRSQLMIRVTFVMEQHIGHRSFYENLRRCMDAIPTIEAKWVKVTYHNPVHFWQRLSFIPAIVRGTMSGRLQVRQGLRQNSCDVAFFNTQVPAALAGPLLDKQPYVVCTDITPRQYDRLARHYRHRPDGDNLWSRYKHRINVNTFRRAERILPWSSWAQSSIVQEYGIPAAKTEVLPPGVDIQSWQPGSPPSRGPLRILFVGGDFERKGGMLLLEAFRCLPPGQAELLVVTRTAAPVMAGLPEGVIFYHNLKPNSPQLIALYRSCHVFVLPTEAEAFGIAAVEAAATGLPILATSIGGLTDIVVDGENGFLLEPGDGAGLANRLRRLCRDASLRRRLGHASRARAERYFNAQENAKRLAQILAAVAERREE
jgi:glycosyltransferase involved in cell wall biosynthesis